MRKVLVDQQTEEIINAIEIEENANWSPLEGVMMLPERQSRDCDINDIWDDVAGKVIKKLYPRDPNLPPRKV